eukprot:4485696-Alexandrium_andersonii.AAC.1
MCIRDSFQQPSKVRFGHTRVVSGIVSSGQVHRDWLNDVWNCPQRPCWCLEVSGACCSYVGDAPFPRFLNAPVFRDRHTRGRGLRHSPGPSHGKGRWFARGTVAVVFSSWMSVPEFV